MTKLQEEGGDIIWEGLLDWLSNSDTLPPEVRELFLERVKDFRLKAQVIFVEIQRKLLQEVAHDAAFEGTLRRQLRKSFPYMTTLDQKNVLQVLESTTETRLQRLEAQLAGWDFIDSIATSVETLDSTKVSVGLADKVRQLPSNRRQALLTVLTNIVTEINKDDITEEVNVEKI